MISAKVRSLLIILFLGLVIRLVASVQIYSGDVNNHVSWGKDAIKRGFLGIYERDFYPEYGTLTPTYPSVTVALFTLSQLAYEKTYVTAQFLNQKFPAFPSKIIWGLENQNVQPAFHKIWAILADLGLGIIFYKFFNRNLLAASLIIFNPAFIYNSAFWGQIEAVPLAFLFFALYYLLKSNRPYLSAIFFTLSMLTKQSAIIFAPLYGLIFFKKSGALISLKSVLLGLIIFWVSFLPFYKSGNVLTFPFQTYINKIQTGSGSDYITDHAFNFWALVTGLGKIPDKTKFILSVSYANWGYILFLSALVIAAARIIKKPSQVQVFRAFAIVALGAFLFLTRMHERYLQSALPFLLALGINSAFAMYFFIFVSALSLINLYHNWWFPRIDVLVNLLSSTVTINVLILILLFNFSRLIAKK